MRQIECAGGIVVNPNNQVLVVYNQIGNYTLPKGANKDRETPIETARREIWEETGLTQLKIVRYLGVLTRPGFTADNSLAPSVIKHIDMFHCVTDQMELRPLQSDVKEASWVDPKEVPGRLTWVDEVAFFERNKAVIGLSQVEPNVAVNIYN